ncbi:24663_t:CDS:1, partial [Gigaspora rosea]
NVNSANEIFDLLSENIQINNDLLVSNLTRQDLSSAVPESPILKKLNNEYERSLALYLNRIILNETPESKYREIFTDSLVIYLLGQLRFNIDSLLLTVQPNFKFKIFDKEVSARAEYSVSKGNAQILIDENKHMLRKRDYTENGKSQMSAEILACAFTNFENEVVRKSQTVYAMRVIGTRFTFYKAFMSKGYLESLYQGFPPNNKETRYVYDYADENYRSLIIDLLYRLRECLLKM